MAAAPILGSLSIVSLIFGGCCSNVFALEAIVKNEPDSGLLITFCQFLFAAFAAYPTQFSPGGAYTLKKPQVPYSKWSLIAAMFFSINMLNNWAFAFHISVPVHIILRSFGSVTTMIAGYIRGKRYTYLQVLSVAILTLGVVVSAWADAESKGKIKSTKSTTSSPTDFISGLTVLLVAQCLSAYMGIYVQDTYATHGANWLENLFYSHALSLPLFLPLASTLSRQYTRLAATQPLNLTNSWPMIRALPEAPSPLLSLLENIPSGLVFLALNALTQLGCISGVNLLSARASAVTVTIVLNVRKLVSFVFSTLLFGHQMSDMMIVGAALVFGSGALYGWETSWRIPREREAARQAGLKESKTM